jgi:nucleoside 2-deoxyribosyltransferase
MPPSDLNQQLKVYVASSWRNEYQQGVVKALREIGLDVYDFKNPGPGEKGFGWSQIDPEWKTWTPQQFREALKHPISQRGFNNDEKALSECDACLLVLPSGKSAHLEAGWAAGKGKATAIYIPEQTEPELMYKLFERTTPKTFPNEQTEYLLSLDEVLDYYRRFGMRRPRFDCHCNIARAQNNVCTKCGGSVSG